MKISKDPAKALARWLWNRERDDGRRPWYQLPRHRQATYIRIARDLILAGVDAERLVKNLP